MTEIQWNIKSIIDSIDPEKRSLSPKEIKSIDEFFRSKDIKKWNNLTPQAKCNILAFSRTELLNTGLLHTILNSPLWKEIQKKIDGGDRVEITQLWDTERVKSAREKAAADAREAGDKIKEAAREARLQKKAITSYIPNGITGFLKKF